MIHPQYPFPIVCFFVLLYLVDSSHHSQCLCSRSIVHRRPRFVHDFIWRTVRKARGTPAQEPFSKGFWNRKTCFIQEHSSQEQHISRLCMSEISTDFQRLLQFPNQTLFTWRNKDKQVTWNDGSCRRLIFEHHQPDTCKAWLGTPPQS